MYNLSNINNNWNDLLQQEKSKDYFNKFLLLKRLSENTDTHNEKCDFRKTTLC